MNNRQSVNESIPSYSYMYHTVQNAVNALKFLLLSRVFSKASEIGIAADILATEVCIIIMN